MLPVLSTSNVDSQVSQFLTESADPKNAGSSVIAIKPIEDESEKSSTDFLKQESKNEDKNADLNNFLGGDLKFATVESGIDEEGKPYIEIRNSNDDIISRFPPEGLDAVLSGFQPGSLLDIAI